MCILYMSKEVLLRGTELRLLKPLPRVVCITQYDMQRFCFTEYEVTSTNQVSTIGSRTNNALTFPFTVHAKNTSILHISTSSYEPASVVSVTIYQNQSESSINNSSVHVSNITFAHHNETTGSTNKRHSTLITGMSTIDASYHIFYILNY